MKVNASKTQLLCIHSNANSVITSYIRDGNMEINSSDSLKILGFHFGTDPNAVLHVTKTIDKMYSKLWTLRFLKKAGMKRENLVGIYKDVIRPSAEYSSVVYNSLIPEYLSHKLESVQKQAIKNFYGWDVDKSLIENETISSLKQRRDEATLKFALKAAKSSRFSYWFRETPSTEREVRLSTRNKYIEKACRTERGRNNPLNVITRLLNDHHRENIGI